MPTWRKLHSKVVESQDVNDMPDDFTRLLWVLLPLGLDREGRGLDNPSWIKSKIMPIRDDVTTEMISDAMDWYAENDMIVCYSVSERSYFYIPTFKAYQKTDREAPSIYPDPLATNSRVTHELVATNSSLDEDEVIVIDKVKDKDIEQEIGTLIPYSVGFSTMTGIQELLFSRYDIEAMVEIQKAGVTVEEWTEAIKILQDKEFTIAGPRSVKKTALGVMSKRVSGTSPPGPDGKQPLFRAGGPGVTA